ncbi:hypothetical protein GOBAR_DD27815 [Gossypium barbadense]|nr:hypothetical protein GOBAR_DD27815 [Gossypium barbadense]
MVNGVVKGDDAVKGVMGGDVEWLKENMEFALSSKEHEERLDYYSMEYEVGAFFASCYNELKTNSPFFMFQSWS